MYQAVARIDLSLYHRSSTMQIPTLASKHDGIISGSTLLLLAFASVFFPRLLDTLGAPSPINFVHFATVPLVFGWVMLQRPINNRQHVANCKALLVALFGFFVIITASAVLNYAGLINVVLSFLILTEPLLFLLALVWTPISGPNLAKLKTWFIRFSMFHILLSFVQKLLLDAGIIRNTGMNLPQDNIQGVFFLSGSGHVVASSVTTAFALYYLLSVKTAPLILRLSVLLAAVLLNQFAETKQVLLVCFASFFLLVLLRSKDLKRMLQYLTLAVVAVCGFWWLTQNVALFRGYNTWSDLSLYGPNGEATNLKLASIRIILAHYSSPLNWWLGLGPGHTVGRLGGWMLDKYSDLLMPLGATINPVSAETWDVVWNSRLGPRSSMFSPLWGWAGIWGDLGFLGLGAYLYMAYIVWSRFCCTDLSRFLLLGVFVNGLIFSQMEEPGYTLYTVFLIALIWHQRQQIYRPDPWSSDPRLINRPGPYIPEPRVTTSANNRRELTASGSSRSATPPSSHSGRGTG